MMLVLNSGTIYASHGTGKERKETSMVNIYINGTRTFSDRFLNTNTNNSFNASGSSLNDYLMNSGADLRIGSSVHGV